MTEKISKEDLLKQLKAVREEQANTTNQREAKEAILRGETPAVAETATPTEIKEENPLMPIIEKEDLAVEPPKDPRVSESQAIYAERNKALAAPEADKEIIKEVATLPEKERAKIGWGFDVIGFKAEKIKSDIFASIFKGALGALKLRGGEEGDVGRWCKKIVDANIRNGDNAAKKANDRSAFKEAKIGKVVAGKTIGLTVSAENQRRLANLSGISSNVLKYGTIAYNIFDHTAGAASRIAMAASTATGFMAEEGKKARLENTELQEQRLIEDVEKAADEAWAIWEKAGGKKTDTKKLDADGKTTYSEIKNPTKEDLDRGYLMQMPEDLRKRLDRKFKEGIPDKLKDKIKNNTPSFLSRLAKKDIEIAVTWLEKSLKKIDSNKKLSPEEKELAKEKLLRGQEASLKDWDQIITQYGAADGMAMSLKYLETAGKTATSALQVKSMAFGLRYLADKMPEIDVSKMWHKVTDVLYHHKTLLMAKELTVIGVPPAEHPGPAISLLQPKEGPVSNEELNKGIREQLKAWGVKDATSPLKGPESFTDTHAPLAEGQTPGAATLVNETTDVVQQNEGIEHALIRQIQNDPALAKELAKSINFEGDLSKPRVLKEFAGRAAHKIALDNGYVSKFTGEEIRVRPAGEIAYKLTLSGDDKDPFKVEEFRKIDGEFKSQEPHGKEPEFEGDQKNEYEYRDFKHVKPVPVNPDTASNVDTAVDQPSAENTFTKTVGENQPQFGQNNFGKDVFADRIKSMGEVDTDSGVEADSIPDNTAPVSRQSAEQLAEIKRLGLESEKIKAIKDSLEAMQHSEASGSRSLGAGIDTNGVTAAIPEVTAKIAGNKFDLPAELLRYVDEVYTNNIKNVFSNNGEWNNVRGQNASWVMENEHGLGGLKKGDVWGNASFYLHKLQQVTELKPKGKFLGMLGKPESVEQYVARALQKVAKMDRLDEFKFKLNF